MKSGDLVRVRIRPRSTGGWFTPNNGRVGIIVRPGMRGPIGIWWVLLEDGNQVGFEPTSLEVIA
jgi:hypothetical protein